MERSEDMVVPESFTSLGQLEGQEIDLVQRCQLPAAAARNMKQQRLVKQPVLDRQIEVMANPG